MFHSDQFEPKSHLKLIKKCIFSEGEQYAFTISKRYNQRCMLNDWSKD